MINILIFSSDSHESDLLRFDTYSTQLNSTPRSNPSVLIPSRTLKIGWMILFSISIRRSGIGSPRRIVSCTKFSNTSSDPSCLLRPAPAILPLFSSSLNNSSSSHLRFRTVTGSSVRLMMGRRRSMRSTRYTVLTQILPHFRPSSPSSRGRLRCSSPSGLA